MQVTLLWIKALRLAFLNLSKIIPTFAPQNKEFIPNKQMKELIRLAIFAGMLIGIGGLTYLNVGGLAGAILFAFGLISVVLCKAQLYTGKAGFLPYRDFPRVIIILLGNVIGCALVAVLTIYAKNPKVMAGIDAIIASRGAASWHEIIITSIGTGVIMTLAVFGTINKNFLPLLFGVPVFIMCGLPHCVADAFYYSVCAVNGKFETWMLLPWLLAVVGNYIGCNLPRIMMQRDLTKPME